MNLSIRRFPQRGALPFTLILVVAAFLVFVGTNLVLALVENVPAWGPTSGWVMALQPLWVIAFGTGVALIGYYLRLHVAHGRTRRDFMSQAVAYLVVCSSALAASTTIGFVLEEAIFSSYGWDYYPSEQHLVINSAIDCAVVFARLWLEFGMLIVVGMLVTAGFRRFKVAGLLLTIPLALLMIVLTTDGVGSAHFLGPSFFWRDVALWSSVPSVLLGLATSWALARKVAV